MSSDANDGLGLGRLGDLSAMLDMATVPEKFREIDLDLIREDGENPRQQFNEETLRELADTIRVRGVITPISVRPDPDKDGGFIVNHGHRRLRASYLAGRATIPAVIDDSFRDEDRIIENIQRDNLGMFEVAQFIDRKAKEGMKQKDIASLIGKSTAYVSNHVQILDLPPHTAKAVGQGRITDVTTINELTKAEKTASSLVERFLSFDNGEITRSAVKEFRAKLEAKPDGYFDSGDENPALASKITPGGKPGGQENARASAKTQVTPITPENVLSSGDRAVRNGTDGVSEDAPDASPGEWRGGKVIVETVDGRRGVLRLDKRPKNEKSVWIEWDDSIIVDGETASESEVPLVRLTLLAVVNR